MSAQYLVEPKGGFLSLILMISEELGFMTDIKLYYLVHQC